MSRTDYNGHVVKASLRSSETQAAQEMVPFDTYYSGPVRSTHNQLFRTQTKTLSFKLHFYEESRKHGT